MREIKFRAWGKPHYSDEKEKMYYYPKWSTLHNNTVLYFAEDNEDYVYNSDNNTDLILMEFTGLLDKNGKEVFEGNILKDVTNGIIEIVEGFDFSFGWKQNLNYKEVIGNIFENPKLLK